MEASIAAGYVYRIVLNGCVQGVGMRRHAVSLAARMGIVALARYSNQGVDILLNADYEEVTQYLNRLLSDIPEQAVVESYMVDRVDTDHENGTDAPPSDGSDGSKARPTPDLALCPACRSELFDPHSIWYRFPFISCSSCGWRLSITKALPAVRSNLTISQYKSPDNWITDRNDRRYLAETILSETDYPEVFMLDSESKKVAKGADDAVRFAVKRLEEGRVVALKDVGMYILLADAASAEGVGTLRNRKQSSKPFYLVYPDIRYVENHFMVSKSHHDELLNGVGAVVLLTGQTFPENTIAEAVTMGRYKVGVMLPNTPLLAMLAHDFGRPLAFTGFETGDDNLFSGENQAEGNEQTPADYTLSDNLLQVTPQNTSVVEYSSFNERRVVHSYSRGMAPNLFGYKPITGRTLLATGVRENSGFAIIHNQNTYVSQQLAEAYGDAYLNLLKFYSGMMDLRFNVVLSDDISSTFGYRLAEDIALQNHIPSDIIPHHKAHFAAVLAENGLLSGKDDVLGVIWDEAVQGLDGDFYGGEFLLYSSGVMRREARLELFKNIIGKNISNEPRLSALSMFSIHGSESLMLHEKFTEREWLYYNKMLAGHPLKLTSSMASVVDAVASVLNLCDRQKEPGDAAQLLEDAALRYVARYGLKRVSSYFDGNLVNGMVPVRPLIEGVTADIVAGRGREEIGYKFFYSLADMVDRVAAGSRVWHIAFSGSIMMNTLLIDILDKFLSEKYFLYFHKHLPSNDICVPFGQLVYYDQGLDSHILEQESARRS